MSSRLSLTKSGSNVGSFLVNVKRLPVILGAWLVAVGCAAPEPADGVTQRRRQSARLKNPEAGTRPAVPTRPSRRPSKPSQVTQQLPDSSDTGGADAVSQPVAGATQPLASEVPQRPGGSAVEAPGSGNGSGRDEAQQPALRRRSRQVDDYIRQLQGNPKQAAVVFRKLWELPSHLVPYLVREVDHEAPSSLKELSILVLNTDTFVRFDPDTQEILGYKIPGMGDVVFDQIASGKVARGYRVTLRHRRGFAVGVVVRAALINRFRSTNYPAGDARGRAAGWWDAFYRRVKDEL